MKAVFEGISKDSKAYSEKLLNIQTQLHLQEDIIQNKVFESG